MPLLGGNPSPTSDFNQLAFLGYTIVNGQNQTPKIHQPVVTSCREALPKSLKSDEVLVKVTRTSICQTDRRVLAKQKKHALDEKNLCLGHEGGGQVVVAADSNSSFTSGQKVVFLPHYSCMNCFQCRRGNTNLCPEMKHLGIHLPGVFSHFIAQPARCLYPLPENFSDDLIPLVEPLSCAIRGWSRMNRATGPIAIYGAGPMGVLLALYAKQIFPGVTVDLIETNPVRRHAVQAATGMTPLKRPKIQYQTAVIASSEVQAYKTGIKHLARGGQVMAFSGINLGDLTSDKARRFEKIHRQEEIHVIDQKQRIMIGTSGFTKQDIAASVSELSINGAHYRTVQNARLDGLLSPILRMKDGKVIRCEKSAVVALLETDSELQLTDLQASVLKLLIKMEE